eukprot:GEMP01036890.1.p1 GENE.GEMP01036890.1~~GEMP01036890.1.p1  ORF type:complete len:257 (+),score=81.39 GEMP01036890.1:412-1182(+)
MAALEPGEEEVAPFMVAFPPQRVLEWSDDVYDSIFSRANAIGPLFFNNHAPVHPSEAIAVRDKCVEEFGVPPTSARPHFGEAFDDYYQRYAELIQGAQAYVMRQQLALCEEMGKPCVVRLPLETGKEESESEQILQVFEQFHQPVMLSAYQGTAEFVLALRKQVHRLYVGASGLLTFTRLKELLSEIVFDTPMESLVLESVGPHFPASPGGRGEYSHPAMLPIVAEHLAEIKRVSVEEMLAHAFENAKALFHVDPL